jgi:hypothetical protein
LGQRSSLLFKQKKNIIHTLLFLNTAFSMIDQMFQQEIMNAKLKQQHWTRFRLNSLCTIFCSTRCFLPAKFIEPEKSGGDILQKLMGFDKHLDIDDEDIDLILRNRQNQCTSTSRNQQGRSRNQQSRSRNQSRKHSSSSSNRKSFDDSEV